MLPNVPVCYSTVDSLLCVEMYYGTVYYQAIDNFTSCIRHTYIICKI